MLIQFLRNLYEEDDDHPSPEGNGKVRASDLRAQLGAAPDEQALMRLLEKHAEVLTDNAALRAARRQLRTELTDLKGKQAPEGSRVITAEEAKSLEAYAALGKPDALKQALEQSAGAAAELAKLKRERQLTEAADAVGYKASVLGKLPGIDTLQIEVRPVKDGKPQAVVVKDGAETALEDYAKDAWADFLPALQKTGGERHAPDINAGARGNGNSAPIITDDERQRIADRYRHTF